MLILRTDVWLYKETVRNYFNSRCLISGLWSYSVVIRCLGALVRRFNYCVNLSFFYFQMSKLVQINHELQVRLQHYEVVFEQVRLENIIMQEKLFQMGINVLDLVKANCNGNLKMIRSPSGSPPQQATPARSPTEHASSLLAAGFPLHQQPGLLPSHSDRFIKKEHDSSSWGGISCVTLF